MNAPQPRESPGVGRKSIRPDRQRVREQIAQQMLHKPREKG